MARLRLPNTFVGDVGALLSATDINLLIAATQQLDGWSMRRMPTFDSSCGDPGGAPFFNGGGGYHTNPPFRVWKGGAIYRDGCTDIHMTGQAVEASGVSLAFYVNGALKGTLSGGIPTPWAIDLDISTGYSAGQALWVEVRAEGSGSIVTRNDQYAVYEAYMTPVTAPAGWVAPGTWGAGDSVWDSTRLNKLIAAANWLFDRINLIPIVPRLGMVLHPGPAKDPVAKPEMAAWPIYDGYVLKTYAFDEVYRVSVTTTNYSSPGERWKLYYNGSLVYTSSTRGPGTYNDWIPIALTHTLGARARIQIIAECVTANADKTQWKDSRYSVLTSRTERAASATPFWAPPAELSYASTSDATVKAALNSIANQLIAIKSRIDGTPWVWGRYYLQRKWYGYDDRTDGKSYRRAAPQFVREGDVIHLLGKGVTLGYGARTPPEDTSALLESYTYSQQHEVITADKEQTTDIYLDSYADLDIESYYYLLTQNNLLAEEYLAK